MKKIPLLLTIFLLHYSQGEFSKPPNNIQSEKWTENLETKMQLEDGDNPYFDSENILDVTLSSFIDEADNYETQIKSRTYRQSNEDDKHQQEAKKSSAPNVPSNESNETNKSSIETISPPEDNKTIQQDAKDSSNVSLPLNEDTNRTVEQDPKNDTVENDDKNITEKSTTSDLLDPKSIINVDKNESMEAEPQKKPKIRMRNPSFLKYTTHSNKTVKLKAITITKLKQPSEEVSTDGTESTVETTAETTEGSPTESNQTENPIVGSDESNLTYCYDCCSKNNPDCYNPKSLKKTICSGNETQCYTFTGNGGITRGCAGPSIQCPPAECCSGDGCNNLVVSSTTKHPQVIITTTQQTFNSSNYPFLNLFLRAYLIILLSISFCQ